MIGKSKNNEKLGSEVDGLYTMAKRMFDNLNDTATNVIDGVTLRIHPDGGMVQINFYDDSC